MFYWWEANDFPGVRPAEEAERESVVLAGSGEPPVRECEPNQPEPEQRVERADLDDPVVGDLADDWEPKCEPLFPDIAESGWADQVLSGQFMIFYNNQFKHLCWLLSKYRFMAPQ